MSTYFVGRDQETTSPPRASNSRMAKTALVLSGGGMFGAYQAGAWRALSRVVKPDIVVGASVGALNGWLIAAGMSGEDLVQHWLDPASGELMPYRIPRLPWKGVFDPQPLRNRAKHLMEHYLPRVDYGVVLVHLPRLRPKLFRNGDVTWQHLVASCAVPVGFPPVRIGGALYCDGGVLEALPLWAAEEMGATRVIAVNASKFIAPWAVGIMIKGVRRLGRVQPRPPGDPRVTLITPTGYLGNFLDGATWRRENIVRWIELGEVDAIAALSRDVGCPISDEA
jgi:predicted acylesterase/phospholipase RssA